MSEKVPEFVLSPKGTKLPLLNLRGKPYLMGAYRLVWLNEEYSNFNISSEFLKLENDYAVCRSTVILYDKEGKPIKSATATKKETQKDFPDFAEKAESSSIFRALAMLGMGTQFALADMDEGNRLADSPVQIPERNLSADPKPSSFRKPKLADQKPAVEQDVPDSWS